MFNPKYTISNLLLGNIKRITEIIVDLNSRNFSGLVLAELEKRAREVSAFSSTSIEGNPLPLTDVKRILKTRPEHIRDSEKEVLNYNKALVELNDSIKNKKRVFDLPLILKIQETITQGLIEKYRSGKLRQEPVFVNNPKTRQTAYLPPEHKEVSKLMQELLDYIEKNKNTVDPLILAGIFHKQFVIIHPFIDGNGRTARLTTKVLLAKMGLNTFNLFSFENYYNKNVSKYFQEVGLFGNYYEIKDQIDFTSWLEYFTDGIIDELLRVSKEMKQEAVPLEKDLRDHHRKIINFIEENEYISDRDYAKLTDRAKPTRNLDFRKLIGLGIIEKMGRGKATYYKLKK
ncbi:MAG: Fic family protein [Parcubacteria group bacterium]|jgi:Fic family protein